jgi:glycosyltransferase involved in cell wall biosynthesis
VNARRRSPRPRLWLVNGLAASQGGIVRVLECICSELVQTELVMVALAPNGADLPAAIPQRHPQSGSRLRDVVTSVAPKRPIACDVRLDVGPSLYFGARAFRRILIVNDLGFRNPNLTHISRMQKVYRRIVTWRALTKSDSVVCISETSATEVRTYYPDASAKISVLPLPVSHVAMDRRPAQAVIGSSSPSLSATKVLMFGHSPHKGVKIALDAARLDPNLQLSVVAPVSVSNSYSRQWPGLINLPNVHLLHEIGDEELVREYESTDVFCMPSEYEGYGLPVAEALSLGVPTVISDIPVLASTGRGYAIVMKQRTGEGLLSAIREALRMSPEHWKAAADVFALWTWKAWVDHLRALGR